MLLWFGFSGCTLFGNKHILSTLKADPNVLAVATGIEEHNRFGLNFIEAVCEIKRTCPGVRTSGGISNLSFSFRGNNVVREAMHSAFLYHAIRAGLDMGIVNAGQIVVYEDIPDDLLERVEDVILDRRPDAGAAEKQELRSVTTGATGEDGESDNGCDGKRQSAKSPQVPT